MILILGQNQLPESEILVSLQSFSNRGRSLTWTALESDVWLLSMEGISGVLHSWACEGEADTHGQPYLKQQGVVCSSPPRHSPLDLAVLKHQDRCYTSEKASWFSWELPASAAAPSPMARGSVVRLISSPGITEGGAVRLWVQVPVWLRDSITVECSVWLVHAPENRELSSHDWCHLIWHSFPALLVFSERVAELLTDQLSPTEMSQSFQGDMHGPGGVLPWAFLVFSVWWFGFGCSHPVWSWAVQIV